MRLLHARHPDVARLVSRATSRIRARRRCANSSAATSAAAPAMCRSSRPRSMPRKGCAMLDLGTSFIASVARDPNALAIVDGDVRLTYARMVPAHLVRRRRPRHARPEGRRPHRHGADQPPRGRDPALGLPVRRRHHHAGQLARHRRRSRFLLPGCRRKGADPRGRLGAGRARQQGRLPGHERRRLRRMVQAASPRRAAARRCRGLVGDALHVGHDRAAEGRAAPPARRTRRRARPCGAEHVSRGRAHARRDAALSHHGRALAARDVADRRHVRVPAALRCRARAGADRRREDHQSLSRADALSRRAASSWLRADRRHERAQARLRRRLDDRRAAQGAERARSGRTCSSITTARRRSTPSPSTRTRPPSPARPGAPGSTSSSAW